MRDNHAAIFTLILAIEASGSALRAEFVGGLYQITSGTYTQCCGIAGAVTYDLPNKPQSFVKLTVDSQAGLASMTFLASDAQTIFSEAPCPPEATIYFSFDYGFVSSDQIFFHVDPGPDQKFWSYTVTNSLDSLRIDGQVGVSEGACSDVPNRFTHAGVVARLLTNAPVIIDQIQRDSDALTFHFTGEPPYDYTVQYSDSLTKTNWQSLGVYRASLDIIDVTVTNALSDAIVRFFRIRKEPCNCQ